MGPATLPSRTVLRLPTHHWRCWRETSAFALLTRQARGVTLTPAGHVLAEHARRCVAQLEQMHVDLLPFARGLNRPCHVFRQQQRSSVLTCRKTSHASSTSIPAFVSRSARNMHQSRHRRGGSRRPRGHRRSRAGNRTSRSGFPALSRRPPRAARAFGKSAGAARHRQFCGLYGRAVHQPAVRCCVAHVPDESRQRIREAPGHSGSGVGLPGAIARLVSSGAGIGVVARSAIEESDSESLAVLELSEAWARARSTRVRTTPSLLRPISFRDKLIEILCNEAAGINFRRKCKAYRIHGTELNQFAPGDVMA